MFINILTSHSSLGQKLENVTCFVCGEQLRFKAAASCTFIIIVFLFKFFKSFVLKDLGTGEKSLDQIVRNQIDLLITSKWIN